MAFGTRPFPSRSDLPPALREAAGRGRRAGRDGDEPRTVPARAVPGPADPVEAARQICLNQLDHAPRTRAQLREVLARKGVEDDVAEQVLGRFAEVGLIDDAVFAQLWVTSRHRGKGLARRALAQELRRKGVADETVAEALATLEPEQELATARALVQRRLRTTCGLAPDARGRRLAGMLARKGYPAGVAFRVVKEALATEGVEAELAFEELSALGDEPPG